MIIVFFVITAILIIIIMSLKIGIFIKINPKNEIIKIFYVTVFSNIKIYSKPLVFKNKKQSKRQIKNINRINLIKEMIKVIKIKEFKFVLKLNKEDMILNTYITAIVSVILESLRKINKIENMYYKIENDEENKIMLEMKAEAHILRMRKGIIKCINILNKEKIYNNK